jgi:hypothetical protein
LAVLIMMALAEVLTRLALVYLRRPRVAAGPAVAGAQSRPVPVPDLVSRHAAVHAWQPVTGGMG